MKPLTEEILSHVKIETMSIRMSIGGKPISLSEKDATTTTGLRPVSVAQVRQSDGFPISRYSNLASCIAELGFFNQHLNLLYRGQQKDYLDKKYKRTKVYPSIFRPEIENGRVTKILLEKRFESLSNLRSDLRKARTKISFHKGLSGYAGPVMH